MAYDEDDTDGQAGTADNNVSCRLCCEPSVAAERRHPIVVAAAVVTDSDDDGTRPGDLRDIIVKYLRIQVSEFFHPWTVHGLFFRFAGPLFILGGAKDSLEQKVRRHAFGRYQTTTFASLT